MPICGNSDIRSHIFHFYQLSFLTLLYTMYV
nr:MAG TPA: hypothetical protein [Caudoviricetes sp.]